MLCMLLTKTVAYYSSYLVQINCVPPYTEHHAAKRLPVHNIIQRAEGHPSSSPMNTTEFPGSRKSLLVNEK
jgi:hypothetical protein